MINKALANEEIRKHNMLQENNISTPEVVVLLPELHKLTLIEVSGRLGKSQEFAKYLLKKNGLRCADFSF